MRKQLLEYDDVSNDQRKVIYQQRNAILDAQDLSAQIAALREGCFHDLVRQYVPPESVEEQWDIAALQKQLAEEWHIQLDLQNQVAQASAHYRRRPVAQRGRSRQQRFPGQGGASGGGQLHAVRAHGVAAKH